MNLAADLRCCEKCYGAGRLTKRPWSADQHLNDIYEKYILQSKSMCRTIANSTDIKHMFERHLEKLMAMASESESLPFSARIRGFQAARHRFASTQKPLGRFILYFPAVVATALELQVRRSNNNDMLTRARSFLESVDEEVLLQIAMLADAGDQASAVVRFFDADSFDVADTRHTLSRFLEEIDTLFLQRACLSLRRDDGSPACYTSYILDMLQTPIQITTYQAGRAVRRSIGGQSAVSEEVIDRCLAHMAGWVRLTAAAVQGEFPDWDVCSAFSVFDLDMSMGQSKTKTFVKQSLTRLAKTFDCHPGRLEAQYQDFRKSAVHHKTMGKNNFDAWKASVMSQHRYGSKSAHSAAELLQILATYGVFIGGASTSSVERCFAALRVVHPPGRQSLSAHSIESDLRVKLFLKYNNESEGVAQLQKRLCLQAVKVWLATYPPLRRTLTSRASRSRWTSGSQKKVSKISHEMQFLAERRTAVTKATAKSSKRPLSDIVKSATTMSAEIWSETHAKAGAPISQFSASAWSPEAELVRCAAFKVQALALH